MLAPAPLPRRVASLPRLPERRVTTTTRQRAHDTRHLRAARAARLRVACVRARRQTSARQQRRMPPAASMTRRRDVCRTERRRPSLKIQNLFRMSSSRGSIKLRTTCTFPLGGSQPSKKKAISAIIIIIIIIKMADVARWPTCQGGRRGKMADVARWPT